jgi:hypothetical protein
MHHITSSDYTGSHGGVWLLEELNVLIQPLLEKKSSMKMAKTLFLLKI